MSKDIRSFFAVKSSALTQKKLSFKGENAKSHQKKRTALVIDSDSDDDVSFGSVKRSKVSSTVVDKNNGPVVKNDRSPRKKTSKYFQAESVNASDMFGERPVKRDSARNIIKKTVKKESLEFHTDKELESELMNLDFNEDSLLTNGGIDCKIDSHDPSNCEATEKRLVNRDKETSLDCDEPGKKVPKIERNISPRKSPWKKTTEESKVIHKDSFDCDESSKKKAKLENHLRPHLSPSKKLEIKTMSDSLKVETLSVKSSKKLDSESKQSTTRSNSLEVSPSKGKSTMKSPSKLHLSENLSSPISKTSPTEKKNKNADSNLSTGSFYKKISLFVEKEEKRTDTSLSHKTTKEKASSDKLKSKNIAEDNKAVTDSKTLNDLDSSLWVEKYKPTTTKQIIGQQGDKSCVNKLTMWLKNWYQNQSGSKKLAKPSPWAKNDDGGYFKAALLSGPPGVGKTTTAHLVSKELGFDVVEFNASDTRSKKLLHQEVSELLSTSSLNPYFTGKGEQVTKQHVLLMDEVDGMAGNEDRGGVQELIQLIKQSRVPIICMCNDRNHPKIRSLANYCFDLRFSKPRVEQIRGAMLSMCFKEKLKLTPNVLSDVITSANQDIRLIINHLSMLSMESSKLENSTKHIKMGPWDITRKVFSEEEHKTMTIYDKCDLFFHDYSVTPLFVQENYLNAVPHKPEAKNKIKKMELFAAAAKSLSFGDLAEKSIRSHNAWGLLPVQAIFSSLVPGDVLEGHIGAQINFPAWFGKNSRQTKMSRLLQELTVHSRLKISGNKEAMNLDYLTPLESSIVSPLVREGTDGIPEALAVLSEYCLVREDMESLAELSSWPNTKNRFSEVESKVKAAFTRAYNKTSAPTPYAPAPVKKANRADTDFSASTPEEEEETSQGLEEEEEDDDDLEVDGMIVMKKKQVAKKADKEEKPSTSKNSKPSKRGRKK